MVHQLTYNFQKLGRKIQKWILAISGSRIMLRNDETKDIAKVIRSSQNRGILLKGITRRTNSQE